MVLGEYFTRMRNTLSRFFKPPSWSGRGGGRGRHYPALCFAVAVPLATLLVRKAMGVEFGERPLLILFMFPIMLSAYIGGLVPGLISTFLSAALTDYFLIPPLYSFTISRSVDIGQWFMMIMNGVCISILTEALHRARARSEKKTADFLAANEKLEAEILDRARIEQALRESESRIRSIFLAAPVGIGIVINRNLVDVNDTLCAMTGYAREDLIGQSSRVLYPGDDDYEYVGYEKYRQIAEKGTGTVETRWQRKEGDIIHIILSSTPLDWRDLSKGVTFTALDISDRKRTEKQLRNSLKEKEVLLREVHHRVKNNLQIISSLLDLQSESIRDEDALRSFRESQNRVKAMALIHGSLYESLDFASIDFAEYIENLCTHLFESYQVDPGRLALKVDAGGISIGIDRAIPCGLIINELVSNALKHAFPGNRTGEISIRFYMDEDGWITLAVADTGVGIPPDLEYRNAGTLGLQLVDMLACQLGGRMSLLRKEGTTFVVRFRRSAPD